MDPKPNSYPCGGRQHKARNISRREFIPRAAAAALGAGALLHPGALLARQAAAAAPGPMRFRTLGKTGISVSQVGFGSHLTKANENNPQTRAAQIRAGIEQGINLFDIYEHSYHQFAPMSEVLGPVRQDVVLSLVTVWKRDQTMGEVDFALKVFKTDYIDLYRIYWEPAMGDEEIEIRFDALRQAKEQGKIRAVGLVTHDHAALTGVLRSFPDLDYLMLPYNFQHQSFSPMTAVQPVSWARLKAEREPAPAPKAAAVDCLYEACNDPELLPLVRQTGVGLIAIKPFAGGGLLQLPSSDPLLEKLVDVEASFPQAALRFSLQSREVCSVIPAMNSIDEVAENVGAGGTEGLSAADVEVLQLYAEAAERSRGSYLPDHYKWLETWKA